MTGRYAVIGWKLKQNADDGCNSCASLAGLVLIVSYRIGVEKRRLGSLRVILLVSHFITSS